MVRFLSLVVGAGKMRLTGVSCQRLIASAALFEALVSAVAASAGASVQEKLV